MFEWIIVRSGARDVVAAALSRAWRGEAAIVELPFGRVAASFILPGAAATARRKPHWPEVLADWVEIYEERLFPTDLVPVLGEELAGLGLDVLATCGELDLRRATAAWYRKGALAELEYVGGSQVAWTPEQGLGRPFDGKGRTVAAHVGSRIAELVGDERSAGLMDRLAGTSQAVGEAILQTALRRLLDEAPPALDALAGRVATAPAFRLRLP